MKRVIGLVDALRDLCLVKIMLYVVPTPIGNIEDITLRALRLLKEVEVIICEDSRKIRQLIKLLDIEGDYQFIDYVKNHHFNEQRIKEVLSGSVDVALVTDAGTPGISDPGLQVITMAQSLGVSYTVLPGATAMIPAIVASGLVSKELVFLGFLPTKKGRQTAWKKITQSEYPVVLYESVHRIEKFITEAQEYLDSGRKICICRELTKKFEQVDVMKVEDLKNFEPKLKGEFVIVIDNR